MQNCNYGRRGWYILQGSHITWGHFWCWVLHRVQGKFHIGGKKNKSLSHPGQGVEDGVAEKKAGKAGCETGGDSKGNRVNEGSLVNGQGTSIIEILFLRFYHLQRESEKKTKWETKR